MNIELTSAEASMLVGMCVAFRQESAPLSEEYTLTGSILDKIFAQDKKAVDKVLKPMTEIDWKGMFETRVILLQKTEIRLKKAEAEVDTLTTLLDFKMGVIDGHNILIAELKKQYDEQKSRLAKAQELPMQIAEAIAGKGTRCFCQSWEGTVRCDDIEDLANDIIKPVIEKALGGESAVKGESIPSPPELGNPIFPPIYKDMFEKKPDCDMAGTDLCKHYQKQPECHYESSHGVKCMKEKAEVEKKPRYQEDCDHCDDLCPSEYSGYSVPCHGLPNMKDWMKSQKKVD
jgi:hypothetical protein